MTQDTPPDLHTFDTVLRTLVRRLLAGAGLVLAFWAFTALSQAHADPLPPHSPKAPRPPHVKTPTRVTARSGTHAVSRVPGGLTARTGTGTKRPVSRILHGARKTVLGTARTPAALVHAAVPATRTRLGGLSHDLGLPKPPPSLTPPAVQGPVGVPPIGARTQRPRPGPVKMGDEPVTSPVRMKLTGTIAPAPRRHDVRPAPTSPMPVPAPVSGAGSGGDSGGKTSSSAGDLPRLRLPAPGLWTLASEPETTIIRNIADKPPFSPD